MKIERINENQIRCTLNVSDLRARHLSLRELAYGSDKARLLFREMLERAGDELGFQAEDTPLMIEAIPLSGENIMLLVTKMEDPEELDTRFARFAPSIEESSCPERDPDRGPMSAGSAADILDSLNQMLSQFGQTSAEEEKAVPEKSLPEILCVYRFDRLDPLMDAAAVLRGFYAGENSVYKCETDGCYYLAAHRSGHTPEEFNKVCNILSEFGQRVASNSASEAYYREHFRLLLGGRALQQLAKA